MIRHGSFYLAASGLVALVSSGCAGEPRSASGTTPSIMIQAKKFAFTPVVIHVRQGVRTTLTLVSLDRVHGFSAPGLGVRSDLVPGRPATVHIKPEAAGTFPFRCDVFCGDGHEAMTGQIVVDPNTAP